MLPKKVIRQTLSLMSLNNPKFNRAEITYSSSSLIHSDETQNVVYGCFGCFLEFQMKYDLNIYAI